MIAELVLGAVLILTGNWDTFIGRIQGTFLIVAFILFVDVNSFIRMEKGDKTIQFFALVCFISSLIWGIMTLCLLWEIVPTYWVEKTMRADDYYYNSSYVGINYHMTFYSICMLVLSYAMSAGFWISNVLSIKETIKLVKPLKITAVVCVAYLWIFGTIVTIVELNFENMEKLYQLAGLAGFAFGITALAALIVSKTNKNKVVGPSVALNEGVKQFTPKTEAELRAEIEEKVRREMMEKEVRAKMEAEKLTMDGFGASNTQTTDDKKENSGPTQFGVAG